MPFNQFELSITLTHLQNLTCQQMLWRCDREALCQSRSCVALQVMGALLQQHVGTGVQDYPMASASLYIVSLFKFTPLAFIFKICLKSYTI